jgi:hypothetical protein
MVSVMCRNVGGHAEPAHAYTVDWHRVVAAGKFLDDVSRLRMLLRDEQNEMMLEGSGLCCQFYGAVSTAKDNCEF